MNFIKSIYLFIVFKFAPEVIDGKSSKFWISSVNMLNEQRAKSGAFYLWKCGRLFIRDPHSYPMRSHWTSSSKHPFCWYIG